MEKEKNIQELENKIGMMQQSLETYQSDMSATLRELLDTSNQMITQIMGMLSNISTLNTKIEELKLKEDNLKYELLDPRIHNNFFFPNILSREETIKKIIKEGKSMARFGDGEFSLISEVARQKFQRSDPKLAERLREVLGSEHPKLLVCIADNYGNLDKYEDTAAIGIREYMQEPGVRESHMNLLNPGKVYYDAYVSRPYVIYKDWRTDKPKKRFDNLKKIWENRNVIIVEGAQTRMGVGNDLLSGAREIKRILAPAVNSFERYDDILKVSLEYAEENVLFLIAMGPSAGVLAYDLTLSGSQALDIGHLDLEYEWFLAGKGTRVPVPYKYINEINGGECVEEIEDPEYESQIVAVI